MELHENVYEIKNKRMMYEVKTKRMEIEILWISEDYNWGKIQKATDCVGSLTSSFAIGQETFLFFLDRLLELNEAKNHLCMYWCKLEVRVYWIMCRPFVCSLSTSHYAIEYDFWFISRSREQSIMNYIRVSFPFHLYLFERTITSFCCIISLGSFY